MENGISSMEYDVSAATKASTPDIVPQDVETLSDESDKPVSYKTLTQNTRDAF